MIDKSDTWRQLKGGARAWAATGREAQRLFVSPADAALAHLRRMCDIRFPAVNPAAPNWSRARCDQTFSFPFFVVFRPIMINKIFDLTGKVTAAEPAR
jgi:hypothetical protein